MKYLVYSPFSTDCINASVLMDYSLRLLENANNTVYYVFLRGGGVLYNDCNYEGTNVRSVEIAFDNWILHRQFHDERLIKIPVSKEKNSQIEVSSLTNDIKCLSDVKNIYYKGVNVGYGTVSSFVSFTRNINPIISGSNLKYIQNLLKSCCEIVDALQQVVMQYGIEHVVTFNGRFATIRPAVEIAKANNLNYTTIDMRPRMDSDNFRYELFENTMPHSIKMRTEEINTIYEREKDSINKYSEFYEKRAKGIMAGDKVYISGQDKDRLPDNWNHERKNIVFFSSSEDEFFSIGEEWEKGRLFRSQEDALVSLSEICEKLNAHLYVRIHPNLTNLPYGYARFFKIRDKSNVTIIEPDSNVSSYQLLKNASAIVTMGSTMGVEATYWGKVSILLNPAFYYYIDAAYTPKTVDEIETLLKEDVKPKPQINALKYAAMIMCPKQGNLPKYCDFNFTTINFREKILTIPNSMVLFRSRYLYYFVKFLFRVLNALPRKIKREYVYSHINEEAR